MGLEGAMKQTLVPFSLVYYVYLLVKFVYS